MKKAFVDCRLSVVLSLALALVATFAAAVPGDLTFRFSSAGPDTYADGSAVLPGECYALVWTRDGATFAGFAADGTAANPADSAVLIVAPLATRMADGTGMHCPSVVFQLDAGLAEPYADGTLAVYLLDTRLATGALSGVDVQGRPRAVNAYGAVVGGTVGSVSYVGSLLNGTGRATASMEALKPSAVPADAPQPQIKSIRRIGDKAYLAVADTLPCLQYNATAGETPQTAVDGGNAAEAPKNGAVGEDVILVVPAKGERGFYRVKRN